MILLYLAVITTFCCCRPYHSNLKIYLNKTVKDVVMKQLESQVDRIFRGVDWAQKTHCHNSKNIEYLKLGRNQSAPKALIVCGIHARELISVDTCVNFLNTFVEQKQLNQKWQIDMILVANSMRYKVLQGQTCIRKDDEGVDLNRNYDVDFYEGEKDPQSPAYRGLYPLSQPLSKCVDNLLRSNNYTTVIDIHTGQYTLYHHTDKNRTQHRKNVQILKRVKAKYCKPCRVTTLREAEDTYVGHLFAYASQHFNVPYPLLFQIFSSRIHQKFVNQEAKCFRDFNPESVQFRKYIIDQWTNILRETLMLIHKDAIK